MILTPKLENNEDLNTTVELIKNANTAADLTQILTNIDSYLDALVNDEEYHQNDNEKKQKLKFSFANDVLRLLKFVTQKYDDLENKGSSIKFNRMLRRYKIFEYQTRLDHIANISEHKLPVFLQVGDEDYVKINKNDQLVPINIKNTKTLVEKTIQLLDE